MFSLLNKMWTMRILQNLIFKMTLKEKINKIKYLRFRLEGVFTIFDTVNRNPSGPYYTEDEFKRILKLNEKA